MVKKVRQGNTVTEMRYMGHVNFTNLLVRDKTRDKQSPVRTPDPGVTPKAAAGPYGRSNEDALRNTTGMSLRDFLRKIVAQPSPHVPQSPSPHAPRALLRRIDSPHPRRPSMEDVFSNSHILVSLPIPEDITKAVCELWLHRIRAATCWWLADEIDFDSPNEEALFTVVRLALIERISNALCSSAGTGTVLVPGQVVLFSGDATNMGLQKAIVAARALTGGDRARARLLDQVLQRRVADPELPVQPEDIPRGDDLAAWQASTTAILRHVFAADAALRGSDLIDALQFAWAQSHVLES